MTPFYNNILININNITWYIYIYTIWSAKWQVTISNWNGNDETHLIYHNGRVMMMNEDDQIMFAEKKERNYEKQIILCKLYNLIF